MSGIELYSWLRHKSIQEKIKSIQDKIKNQNYVWQLQWMDKILAQRKRETTVTSEAWALTVCYRGITEFRQGPYWSVKSPDKL
jgi:hypothetical protein